MKGRPSSPTRRAAAIPLLLVLAIGACSGGSEATPDGGPTGGASTGGAGTGGAMLPLDPAHCSFETPPAHAAAPAPALAPVKAGLGSAVIPMPIGAPLGGYGARLKQLSQGNPADARAPRFTTSFFPSVGVRDAPRAEALALEAGGERLVVVRIDTALINEATLYALEQAAAPDGSLRGRILLTASHSHAAWAGWQPSLVLDPGIDRPRQDYADRVLSALTKAVKDAVAALAPARVGVAIDAHFDPDDTVTQDRRPQNDAVVAPDGNTAGAGKDPIAWALRVDRADGTPLAALVDVPVHGTVGDEDNPLVSGDAPSAVARALSAKLGYPVLHLQGATGDIEPVWPPGRTKCPTPSRCLDMPGLEVLGARAAALLAPLVQGITTEGDAALEVVTRSFYDGRNASVHRPNGDTIAYAPVDRGATPDGVIFDGAGKLVSPIDEFDTADGAGLCGTIGGGSYAPIPGDFGIGAYSSCLDLTTGVNTVLGLFDLAADGPLPFCDTVRVTAAAVRLETKDGGPFLLLGVPGEPTAPWASYLRGRSPAGPDRTLIVGYADDYAGYMLTAEDWLQGGYEPSVNIWGPLEGEIILDGVLAAAKIAWTKEREDPEAGSSRFTGWAYPDTTPITPIATTDHGTVAPASVPIFWPDTDDAAVTVGAPQVPRAVGAARFAWLGGDPAVDAPSVVIERESSPGVFAPLADALGLPADATNGAVVLTYTPDPLADPAPAHHVYAAVWQPAPPDPFSHDAPLAPYALPLGTYRFHVTGSAFDGSGDVPYAITSDPFDVIAAPLDAASSAVKGASSVDIQALLGAAPGMRALREGASDAGVPLPGPWTVEVTFADTSKKSYMVAPDANGGGSLPLPAADLAAAVSVDVRDAAGNGGALALP